MRLFDNVFEDGNVVGISLDDIMSDSFGRYAKYIIQDRALPDIRDGLKPVQRRILYAMMCLGLTPYHPFKKSARTVGEVIGKYHPHGDSSIYEAMVRMSQSWKNNSCLIQMHGNNGSIDGDSAAAMRYTEARLSEYSLEMMKNLEKNTVKFIPNFDDSEREPSVLPTLLPNILINGSSGIAAGYATNIPPFNLKEVCNFLSKYIDNPKMSINDILDILPGPDFPTGAIIQGKDEIKNIYETGKGRIVIKSLVEQENLNSNVVLLRISEIPYDVNKSSLLKAIDEIRIENKVPGIKDVRDESDKNGISICIEINAKKNVEAIKAYLFKNTQLQISYNANIVVIRNKKPIQASIYDIANSYIEWSNEVLIKAASFDLEKYEKRKEIIEGLLIALSQIDNVIKLIRESDSKEQAILKIQDFLNINERQADAIVSLRLYNLTNYDIVKLQEEHHELLLKIIDTRLIIDNEDHRKKIIQKILNDFANTFGEQRKSKIEEKIEVFEFNQIDIIDNVVNTMIVTKNGYIKYITDFIVRNPDVLSLKYKEDDIPIFFASSLSTLQHLFILTSKGRAIIIPIYKIKTTLSKMQYGIHINEFVTFDIDEKIIFCFSANKETLNEYKLLIATKNGNIKQMYTSVFDVYPNVKSTSFIKLKDDDEVVSCNFILDEDDSVVSITKKGLIIKYDLDEVPIQNKASSGVKNIKLKERDSVASSYPFGISNQYLLIFTNKGMKKIQEIEIQKTSRYSIGKMSFMQSLIKQIVISSFASDASININVNIDNKLKNILESDILLSSTTNRINSKDNIIAVSQLSDFTKKNYKNMDAIKNSGITKNEEN